MKKEKINESKEQTTMIINDVCSKANLIKLKSKLKNYNYVSILYTKSQHNYVDKRRVNELNIVMNVFDKELDVSVANDQRIKI